MVLLLEISGKGVFKDVPSNSSSSLSRSARRRRCGGWPGRLHSGLLYPGRLSAGWTRAYCTRRYSPWARSRKGARASGSGSTLAVALLGMPVRVTVGRHRGAWRGWELIIQRNYRKIKSSILVSKCRSLSFMFLLYDQLRSWRGCVTLVRLVVI